MATKDGADESGLTPTTETPARVELDGRWWGAPARVMVVAELGVNHDGSPEIALRLVDAAVAAGADAVKLQLYRAERLIHPSSAFAEYQKKSSGASSVIEMLRKYELSDADVKRILQYARQRGLVPLVTPFSPEDVALIAQLDMPAIKIASPDLVNWPLLRAAAGLGKPMLVSTGASTLDEVATAIRWLDSWGAQIVLMHCVSTYPAPGELANLSWITELAEFLLPVGYSDHTTQLLCGALSVAAGACVIEKHLTHDRAAAGPDHSASADPAEFKQYVSQIRQAEQFMGHRGKRVLAAEQDVRRVSRQSLVVRRDIQPGEKIAEQDLTVQRPGTGLPAAQLPSVVGRVVIRAVRAGEMLDPTVLK